MGRPGRPPGAGTGPDPQRDPVRGDAEPGAKRTPPARSPAEEDLSRDRARGSPGEAITLLPGPHRGEVRLEPPGLQRRDGPGALALPVPVKEPRQGAGTPSGRPSRA